MRCLSIPAFALLFIVLPFLGCGGGSGSSTNNPGGTGNTPSADLAFSASGRNKFGDWAASVSSSKKSWNPGDEVDLKAVVALGPGYLDALAAAGYPVDQFFMLATAERSFDADGRIHLPSDENMSTLLTPAGLAIEGGTQGPITTRYGYAFNSPLEGYQEVPAAGVSVLAGNAIMGFDLKAKLPADLPPGLYRLRADFGIKTTKKWNMDLNAAWMGGRPFSSDLGVFTYCYSPLIPANGTRVSGQAVNASTIQARIPWVLLGNYNSNGYAGVIAEEDRSHYALSPRNIIPDEVVLPLYAWGTTPNTYSLEPGLPVDRIDPRGKTSWDWTKGELSLAITTPDGKTTDLGKASITGKADNPAWYAYTGPTTGNAAFTSWKPSMYGLHTVKVTGWMADTSGRRYEGGGTYKFWIAKRMTMATATFQGMSYPVGTKYGRDIAFSPAVPADVEITATLYPNSDITQARKVSCSGKANRAGVFGVPQGMQQLTLDAAGEYHAKILAKYTDPEGHLWVCVMRHAGVVYADDSTIEAHGKKLNVNGTFVDQGETGKEGWVEANGTSHLEHITFPYNQGDVLLMASESQGANKIEPVLIYTNKGENPAWDTKLNGIGTTNLVTKTSNGYSPHLFPEFITDRQYFYGAGARPGFMSRFVVGDSNSRAPYWATSPNSFGGQIGASNNGDLPGDVYRLMGGVVVRNQGSTPAYAGYLSSSFILPKGSNNNRVIAAGSEDLIGSTGEKARFFLVGLRPGMTFETGGSYRPAGQVDPILPAVVTFVLIAPDGTQKTMGATADQFGSWVGSEAWVLDQAGVYRYQISATWNNFAGKMPGLPDSGGFFFVVPKDLPAGATGLQVDLPNQSTFPADGTLSVKGTTTAATVSYALLMPGCVLAQGELTVTDGTFEYVIDPALLTQKAPIYDTKYIPDGKAQIGKILHLTLSAKEKAADGSEYWDMRRVIVRGTTVLNTR